MYGIRAILVAAALAIGGCRGGLQGVEFRTRDGVSPTEAAAPGDWDDVEAAAIIAAGKVEMAVLMVSPQGDDRIVIDLTTVRDEPARVVVQRARSVSNAPGSNTGGNPDGGRLELRCRVGRFGDPGRERALLSAMARRLGELHRRDTARVRF